MSTEFKVGDIVRMKPEHVKICPNAVHGPFALDSIDIEDIGLGQGFIRRYLATRYEIVEKAKPIFVGIDFTRPVTLRDGRPVRILCTDAKNSYPVVGLVSCSDGVERVFHWLSNGSCYSYLAGTQSDLINPPVKKYLNLFKNGPGKKYFDSEAEAKSVLDKLECEDYLKTIEVEI